MDPSDHRIQNSGADPVNQASDSVNVVDQVNPANQVDQEDPVDQNNEAVRKMKPPEQSREEAIVDHCEDAVSLNNAVDAEENILVKLDKDAKESKTDAKTQVQYNAKENTAKDDETSRTEENEKHVEENIAKRDFEKVAEKDFENADEVAKKVADGMVIEVIINIQLCPKKTSQ